MILQLFKVYEQRKKKKENGRIVRMKIDALRIMHLDLKLSFSSAFEVARKNDEWFIGFKNYKFLVLIFLLIFT